MMTSLPKKLAFSFRGWDAESEKWLLVRFETHLEDFVRRGFHKKYSDMDQAFVHWWIYHGPCGFLTTEDAGLYRRKLKVYLLGKVREATSE